MNYGIICSGTQGQTIIDDENSVLHVMASGKYSVKSVDSSNGGMVEVTYSSPIGTDYPPFVFISPDGAGSYMNFKSIGSSRKWSGFSFYITGQYPTLGLAFSGKYHACGMNPPASSSFGMQVMDFGGEIVFDSGYKVMKFLGGSQFWSPREFLNMSFVFGVWIYSLPWSYGADGYFLINPFGQKSFGEQWFDSPAVGFANSSRPVIELNIVTGKIPAPPMNIPLLVAGL